MPQNTDKTSTGKKQLNLILDAKRSLLMKIRGVTGTGIGFSSREIAKEVVIQIFTDDPERVDDITKEVRSILSGEGAFETVVMRVPKAE